MKHNILIIESGTGWGGSSSFLLGFLKYLDNENFNPMLFLYNNGEGPFVKEIRNLGIKIFFFKKIERNRQKMVPFHFYIFNIFLLIKIINIIKKEKIELIFLNNDLQYHMPGILAAKLMQKPIVCRKSGIGGGKKIKKILSPLIDVFIASSNAAMEDYLKIKLNYKKIVRIYEGVDLEKYKTSDARTKIRKELGVHPENKIVGTISRIVKGKGHTELIKAATLVINEHPEAIFLIVGDEPGAENILYNQLRQQINYLNLEKNIIFTGWRNDIPNLLSAIDIYVQPSVYPEGLCISAIESQACGKPTVVTNAGGLSETTEDNITGFITPVKDSQTLAKNIIRLIEDEKMAIKKGINAQYHVKNKFDIKNNVKKTEQLFFNLLEISPPHM